MRRLLIRITIVGLIALGLFQAKAFAQYRFDHWTTDDGLPQNTVSAILQTRDGYLWLTTAGGLVRFDGLRFTVFDKGNAKGLNSVRFSVLFEDAERTLWIGTEDGGLTRYRNGNFTTFTTEHGLPHNRILALGDDGSGGVLVATPKGVVRWRQEKLLPFQSSQHVSMSETGSCSLARSGTFWCVDDVGLHQIKDDRRRTHAIPGGLASLKIRTFYESKTGEVDRKSTRLNSSHSQISYAVFCLKKKSIRPTQIV